MKDETLAFLRIRDWLEKRIERLTFEREVAEHALRGVETLIAIEEAFKKGIKMAHELQQRLERVEDRIERIERYVKFLAKMPLLVALSLCNLTEEQERKLKEKIHSAPPERLREVAFELDEIRRGRRVVKNE